MPGILVNKSKMVAKYFLSFLIVVLFTHCNNPTPNNTNRTETDSCCMSNKEAMKTELSNQSEITCPKCGHKKMETLPTDVCVIKYTCTNCNAELYPKEGDCCVFCTYGTHKCPSKQEN